MYQVKQSYSWVDGVWIPGSGYITDLDTGDRSVRTYGGAYYSDNVRRCQCEWTSEHFPRLVDVIKNGPSGVMSEAAYREMQEGRKTPTPPPVSRPTLEKDIKREVNRFTTRFCLGVVAGGVIGVLLGCYLIY